MNNNDNYEKTIRDNEYFHEEKSLLKRIIDNLRTCITFVIYLFCIATSVII